MAAPVPPQFRPRAPTINDSFETESQTLAASLDPRSALQLKPLVGGLVLRPERANRKRFHAEPITIPAMNTSSPPRMTWKAAERNRVSM